MPIQSPCVQVCEMNAHDSICSGCFRTREEITHWLAYSDEERELVMLRLGHRVADSHKKT